MSLFNTPLGTTSRDISPPECPECDGYGFVENSRGNPIPCSECNADWPQPEPDDEPEMPHPVNNSRLLEKHVVKGLREVAQEVSRLLRHGREHQETDTLVAMVYRQKAASAVDAARTMAEAARMDR